MIGKEINNKKGRQGFVVGNLNDEPLSLEMPCRIWTYGEPICLALLLSLWLSLAKVDLSDGGQFEARQSCTKGREFGDCVETEDCRLRLSGGGARTGFRSRVPRLRFH